MSVATHSEEMSLQGGGRKNSKNKVNNISSILNPLFLFNFNLFIISFIYTRFE